MWAPCGCGLTLSGLRLETVACNMLTFRKCRLHLEHLAEMGLWIFDSYYRGCVEL
jgi:hypothetical protein